MASTPSEATCSADRGVGVAECLPRQPDIAGAVFDQQDLRWRMSVPPIRASRVQPRRRPGRSGTSNPAPAADSTEMVPPWRSTIFLQMASPMPVPANSSRCAAAGTCRRSFRSTAGRFPGRCPAPRRPISARRSWSAETCTSGVPGFWYLMALPTRFWKSWSAASRRPGRSGRGSWVTSAPLSSMAPRRFASACRERVLAGVSRAVPRPSVPTREIGQQILDQPLHAARAVDREGDELVGIGVELALVPPGQQLGVARHHPQRLLQVVRRDVGELPQLLVRAIQLVHLLHEVRPRRPCATLMSRIAAVTRMPSALSSGLQHDLDRELAAVLAPRRRARCPCRSAGPGRLRRSAGRRRSGVRRSPPG